MATRAKKTAAKPTNAKPASKPASPPEEKTTLTVKVKPDYRWDVVLSAGRQWTKAGEEINPNDADLPELRANSLLIVEG